MKKLFLLLAILFVSILAHAAEFPDISIPELNSAIAAKTVTLLDANGTASWQKGHIPGAIDFKTSGDKLATLLPKDKGALVVAYCGGPWCHAYAAAAKVAEKLGYTNIKHLSAGISGWTEAGQPIEPGK